MTTCTPRQAWLTLLRRIHFYIALFIGPFIFVAALSGTLYVATPQLENWLYARALYSDATGTEQTLASQISVAQQVTGGHLRLHAVRPAANSGETTRVMYADPNLGVSENRAIFIDPVTLEVRGDMTVYGTSGLLPFRQWLDYLHRSLLLGDAGRIYSELAASWMWVAALGGIVLWWLTRPRKVIKNRIQNTRRVHVVLGWSLLAGMLLFSATGLTWSQWAGGNVDKMRAAFGWLTPQVNTALHSDAPQAHDPHAEHAMHHGTMDMPVVVTEPAQFDGVLLAARRAGISSNKVEIRPPVESSKAWTVTEINRAWPTQVDAVAVDATEMQVTDRTRFADFPLMAKLTRWGVDFHMGILFGLPNQVVLMAFGIALCVMIVVGYRIWWLKRPAGAAASPAQTITQAWRALSVSGKCLTLLLTVALGMALPVMGVSLILFFIVDILRWRAAKQFSDLPAER